MALGVPEAGAGVLLLLQADYRYQRYTLFCIVDVDDLAETEAEDGCTYVISAQSDVSAVESCTFCRRLISGRRGGPSPSPRNTHRIAVRIIRT